MTAVEPVRPDPYAELPTLRDDDPIEAAADEGQGLQRQREFAIGLVPPTSLWDGESWDDSFEEHSEPRLPVPAPDAVAEPEPEPEPEA